MYFYHFLLINGCEVYISSLRYTTSDKNWSFARKKKATRAKDTQKWVMYDFVIIKSVENRYEERYEVLDAVFSFGAVVPKIKWINQKLHQTLIDATFDSLHHEEGSEERLWSPFTQ